MDFSLKKLSHRNFSLPTWENQSNQKDCLKVLIDSSFNIILLRYWYLTVVVAGSFFVNGSFSPMDAPTHFRVIAALISIQVN